MNIINAEQKENILIINSESDTFNINRWADDIGHDVFIVSISDDALYMNSGRSRIYKQMFGVLESISSVENGEKWDIELRLINTDNRMKITPDDLIGKELI